MQRRPPAVDPVLAELLTQLDEAYDRQSWHGPNLRGSVRGLAHTDAGWRPAPGRRSIAEHVLHAAYWKYAVRRRLTGEKRGSFPLPGSNWVPLPHPFDAAAWRLCLAVLKQQHAALRAAVAALAPAALAERTGRSGLSHGRLIRGISLHDVYHAGQIQLLKRLLRDRCAPHASNS